MVCNVLIELYILFTILFALIYLWESGWYHVYIMSEKNLMRIFYSHLSKKNMTAFFCRDFLSLISFVRKAIQSEFFSYTKVI